MKFLVATFLLCASFAWGKDSSPESEGVDTHPEGWLPGACTTLITREEIEERKEPFVVDLLRTVPGVVVTQYGSAGKLATLFLRGASPDQTLILIDGVRITDAFGFADLAGLSTASVERIEIVRGAQSARYGSGAMGGVINIITRSGGPIVQARLEGGSDSAVYSVARSGAGSDKNNVAAYFSRYDTDGEQDNDDSMDRAFGFNAHAEIVEGTNLGWIYRESKSNLGIPLSAGQPTPLRRSEFDSNLILIPLTQKIAGWWRVNAKYSLYRQNLHFQDRSDPRSAISTGSFSRSANLELRSRWTTPRGDAILIGYEREELQVKLEGPSGFAFNDSKYNTDSLYGQVQSTLIGDVNLAAGLRYDSNSFYGSKTSPRFAITIGNAESLRFRSSIGSGFRAPRPIELAGPFGNPQLLPETVTSYDLGADYDVLFEKLFLSGTWFFNDHSNWIAFDPASSTMRNFSSVSTSGVELEAEARATNNLSILMMYTYLRTNNKSAGESLLRRPHNSGNFSISYRCKRMNAVFNWNYVGSHLDLDEAALSRVNRDGYSNAGLVLSVTVKGLEAYGRITNLFNRKYEEVFGYPSPNRSFFAGLQLQY